MYPVSSGFLTTLSSTSMQALVLITASDGTTLYAVNGKVDMDCRRSITRTCDLELVPTETMSVDDVYALVMSPSIELSVYRGLLVDGTAEYVPLGVFSTDSVVKKRDSVEWHGSDRSKKISRSKFTDVYSIASGTTLATAGSDLLTSRWSYVTVNFSGVTETIAAPVNYDAGDNTDPWSAARTLFSENGYDLNFDGSGTARAQTIPDPSTVAAVFDCGVGETNLLTQGQTTGTFEQTYNGVIVTGEGSTIDVAVRAESWDTDPSSPTFWQAGFGRVPMFYSSPLLTTTDAAQKAADSMLAKMKGRLEQFSVESVVNPALEPLDVITATLYGRSSRYVIDKVTVPLVASQSMQIVARETRV